MKKLKSICSAIAAFCVLALAGCDLDIPESDKPDYSDEVTIFKGTGEYYNDVTDPWVVYFYPQFGSWDVTTYTDGEITTETESITGANDASGNWWKGSDENKSTATTIAVDSTVKIKFVCTNASPAISPVFEGHTGDNIYFDIDLVNVGGMVADWDGTNGKLTIEGDAYTYATNTVYYFEMTRTGTKTFEFSVVKTSE